MILEIYKWVVIIAVIVSWLIAFNVINTYNNFVRSLLRCLAPLTEPVFRRVRKVMPPMGGLDLSPIDGAGGHLVHPIHHQPGHRVRYGF